MKRFELSGIMSKLLVDCEKGIHDGQFIKESEDSIALVYVCTKCKTRRFGLFSNITAVVK